MKIKKQQASGKKPTMSMMRSFVLLTVIVAVLIASQVSAIQVECRQCHLLRQNEEYFEQAKQVIHKRQECAPSAVVAPVSTTNVPPEVADDIPAPEVPLVQYAASTGEWVIVVQQTLLLLFRMARANRITFWFPFVQQHSFLSSIQAIHLALLHRWVYKRLSLLTVLRISSIAASTLNRT